MRILIVGQAPSRRMAPGAQPLKGTDSWTRLSRLAGLAPTDLAKLLDTTNLIPYYPGASKSNAKHDKTPTRAAAKPYGQTLLRVCCTTTSELKPNVVLLAGRWTTNNLTIETEGLPYFVPHKVHESWPTFYSVPHPGGTNSRLNDPHLRAQYVDFLRETLKNASEVKASIHPPYLAALAERGLRNV